MNQMIPSFVFKRRAWMAIKPWMQVLVVIGLLVVLPGLANQVVVLLTKAAPEGYILEPAQELLTYASQPLPAEMTPEQEAEILQGAEEHMTAFVGAAERFLSEKGGVYFGMMAVEMILTPVFLAPLYGSLLDALRKKELTLAGALGHLRQGPKMLLLQIWTALRVFVWMLPGTVVMFAGAFVPLAGTLLTWVGFIAGTVMGVRAALHYILAPVVLMDKPGESLNGCIRESWQIMRTRKMEYFMLQVSFVGWRLLLGLLEMLAVNPVTYIIVLTLTMMGSMLLTLYINGAVTAFWDAYGVRKEKVGSASFDPQAFMGGDDLN